MSSLPTVAATALQTALPLAPPAALRALVASPSLQAAWLRLLLLDPQTPPAFPPAALQASRPQRSPLQPRLTTARGSRPLVICPNFRFGL